MRKSLYFLNAFSAISMISLNISMILPVRFFFAITIFFSVRNARIKHKLFVVIPRSKRLSDQFLGSGLLFLKF